MFVQIRFKITGETCESYIVSYYYASAKALDLQHTHVFSFPFIYTSQSENIALKATDISSAIVQVLLLACNCPYSLEYVTHSRLLCGTNPHEVIYQSNLLNTDGQTASELVGLVQMWVDNGPTLPVAGVSAVVDPYCQISLSQVGNTEECIALNPTTPTTIESTKQSSSRPSHLTAAIAGGVAGGVATIIVVVLVVGLLCVCRRRDSSSHLPIKKNAASRPL